ncbi:MAG TPA: FecR domain-containing protein [Polyangia bacterium]|nr:FecR domain-containing protein [Polyangia bacterium]
MRGTRDDLRPAVARPEDEALQRLVELTQATYSDEAARVHWPVDESGLRRLEAGGRPRARLRWQAMTAMGFAALLLLAAPAAWFAVRSPGPLTFEVINGTVGAAGEILPGVGTRIRFSDGSEIALDRDARAQVSDVTRVGARIALSNGRAHTFFVHKPGARWQVAAGPYVVQVTGTVFDVQWSADSEAFDVWLDKGSVRVSGPLIGDGIAMTHGQHLRTRMKDNKILLDDQRADAPEAPPEAAPADEAAPEPSAGTHAQAETEAPAEAPEQAPAHIPARVSHPPMAKSWSRRMARGDFEAVVEAAERRGIESVLSHGSRTELSALADAARYTRRNRLAGRALNAERERFPETAEGREATFFLGNLAEDGGERSAAVSWYGRYLREDAAGTYAAQALGRKMLIESRRGSSAAGIDAEEYLHRFPSGSYADAAKLILKQ